MKTILIVDSCAITRECLSAILRAKGHRVLCAGLISQAKTMIAKRSPDVMITEIRLPDDNSLNLMRTLKADPKLSSIKICLLTQAVSKKPIMEAIELGVSKVMLKSKFTIPGFLEQLESVFNADSTPKGGTAGASDEQAEAAPEQHYPLPTPAQDPSLELKNIKPLISRSQLKEQLDEMSELATISDSVTEILKLIDDPETPLEQVSDLIKLDQAIAMKIMRTVNSVDYSRGEQTTRLHDAVVRIGLEELRELITGFETIDPNLCGINQQHFWDHAMSAALCASKIAESCEGVDPELAFTAAILHDTGRMILQQALPQEYQQVLETSHKLGVSLELVEKRLLLSDHSSIAQTMLHSWNLPKDLIDAIANHHCLPNKLSTVCPKNTKLAATIELGNRLAHAMGLGSSGNRTISSTEELFGLLESPELTIKSISKDIEDQLKKAKSLMSSSEDSDNQLASQSDTPVFDKEFNPLFITMNPETDAFEHWVSGLWDGETNAKPNIIVIHVRQPKDRPELSEKLTEAIAKLDMNTTDSALPVLILSSTGKLAPADEVLSKHPSMHLMAPFSVLHFEQAVNHLFNGGVQALPASQTRMAA